MSGPTEPDRTETRPFWWDDAPIEPVDPAMRPPATADVLVIGAGFTGLSAAKALAEAGRAVIVIDAARLGAGASTRNGGMIGWGHRAKLSALARRYGRSAAVEILAEAKRSFDFTCGLIETLDVDCRLHRVGRYLGAASETHFDALRAEAEDLRTTLGFDVHIVERSEQAREIATDAYVGGLLMPEHAVLHPGLFHAGLLRAVRRAGATALGGVAATGVQRDGDATLVETSSGVVRARDVVVAANGYAGAHGRALAALARRVIPLPSYMVATERLGANRIRDLMPGGRAYVDTRSVHSYFRPAPDGDRLLWGGRASLTDISERRAAEKLRGHIASVFPDLRDVGVERSWTGRIAYTWDVIPHIGRLDLGRAEVWHASGYCGSGVAMAPYLGWRLAQKVLGTAEAATGFDAADFRPTPGYWGLAPALRAVEVWHRFLDWRAGVRSVRLKRSAR